MWKKNVFVQTCFCVQKTFLYKKKRNVAEHKKKIKLYNKEYDVEHFRLFSTDPNLPDDKKLNFEVWYDKKKALIIKVAYKRMGLWEYRLKKIQ